MESSVELPVAGLVKKTQRLRSIWRIEASDTGLRATETVCAIKLDSSSSALKMKPSPGFVAAIGEPSYELLFKRTRDMGDLFEASAQSVLGARLGRADAPLPDRPDDPTVVDADKDDKPGVTIAVSGLVNGDIQLVRRTAVVLSGVVAADGKTITGEGTTIFEQNILSASNPLLASPVPETVTATRFTMKRVKDGARCPKR